MSHAEAVKGYFEAFAERDWERFSRKLSPRFSFTSQYDDAIGLEEFRRRCWDAVESVSRFEIVAILERADDVMVRYKGRVNGQEVQNVEHFVFEGETLRSVTVFFGRP
ncbi:MAG: nuclear transport factor 2 family protein [Acidobacteria bacterium]|nr:nuclear transport factor 2 family protein [Acidobacteriota bacterium]